MKELPKNLDIASLSDDEFKKLSRLLSDETKRREEIEKSRIYDAERERSRNILKHVNALVELAEHTCKEDEDLDSLSDYGQTLINNRDDIKCVRCYLNAIQYFKVTPLVNVTLQLSNFIELD